MKMTLKARKPRNPLVAAAMRRQAGRHGQTVGALRQQSRIALRREVDRLRLHGP
jgi:hypothetical protein